MAFKKSGTIFKISHSERIDASEWSSFKQTALTEKIADEEKEANFKVIAEVDPEKFVYIHTTIMAGVKTEENGFYITADTEKYINDNNDAWTCDDLLKDYKSFKNALTFVEHVQDLEKARGKCIDAIARKMPDTVLIDVLFSVDKKHKDLVDNILNNIINAVSMGCSTGQTICNICGNTAKDEKQYCEHIKNKGTTYRCADGKQRKSAEICKDNTFYDVSLVANPAFAGAIFRKILSSEDVSNHIFANLLSNKIESFNDSLLKVASKEDNIQITIGNDGTILINNSGKEATLENKLASEEIENLKLMFKTEQKKEGFFNKILNLFNKEATHPILNTSPAKDFSVDWDEFTPTCVDDRHNVLHNPIKELEMLKFYCSGCCETFEFKIVQMDSLKKGHTNSIVCKCGYITEVEKTADVSDLDKKQLKGLGYSFSEINSIDKTAANIIIAENIEKKSKDDEEFILTSSISVSVDGNDLKFDKEGKSVVGEEEVLKLIAHTEDGNKIYKTELNENLYLPNDFANLKKK